MRIGISPWIIEDGNYTDFKIGEIRQFALEFSATDIKKSDKQVKECKLLYDNCYKINGQVTYFNKKTRPCTRIAYSNEGTRTELPSEYEEEITIIDFGIASAYNSQSYKDINQGDWIEANIYINIDPYDYKDWHHGKENIPNIMFSWYIANIQEYQAALKTVVDNKGQNYQTIDESTKVLINVLNTDAHNIDMHGWYILITERV